MERFAGHSVTTANRIKTNAWKRYGSDFINPPSKLTLFSFLATSGQFVPLEQIFCRCLRLSRRGSKIFIAPRRPRTQRSCPNFDQVCLDDFTTDVENAALLIFIEHRVSITGNGNYYPIKAILRTFTDDVYKSKVSSVALVPFWLDCRSCHHSLALYASAYLPAIFAPPG